MLLRKLRLNTKSYIIAIIYEFSKLTINRHNQDCCPFKYLHSISLLMTVVLPLKNFPRKQALIGKAGNSGGGGGG